MNHKPRVLIFTGDGKGKTTAALGMALRASGHGLRSCVVQFIKGDTSAGEIAAVAASTMIEIHTTGLGFLPPADDPRFAAHRAAAQAGLRKAAEIVASGRFFMVVLDEICLAVACGLLDEQEVVELVARAAPNTCLVLTGREATPALIDLADTVTEMRMREARAAGGANGPEGSRAMKSACPRVVIAGTGSGVGKTSLALGLARRLARQGLRVQTFKVGPDFLDPTYLALASGRTCYNLDGWMTSRAYVGELFARATAGADIAIVEGAMGMFDGASPSTLEGSTAEIALWLGARCCCWSTPTERPAAWPPRSRALPDSSPASAWRESLPTRAAPRGTARGLGNH